MDDQKFIEDFAALLEVSPERITDDFNMVEEAVWDSLAFLSTIALIDTHYQKVVDPMALQELTTFRELRALVHGQSVEA
ncbi:MULTISPECIES: acyl carrier protein [Ralstonia]|jgi:acyl carrier protein|uniref:Acyl carrier protein n=2 Tax=Ralstonia TaxID=48736 RepID=A0A848P7E9_9RALS|nr:MULTISPECIES: phosphopantetheine-binding protein [Ralstonia]NMV41397.1 acyl carrier protein [Ralstonia insidiosa]CAJ0809891.1 hypothetical protein LMG18101_00700 [Ralstonia sp. LMG 18101]